MLRRYVAHWELPDEEVPTVAVLEQAPQGWIGVTAHEAAEVRRLDRRSRRGVRVR